jgi:phosphatidylinositol glycan class C protein
MDAWQRKLYIRRPQFADNYTDATFLSALRKNVNVRVYSLRELVLGAGHVHQHVSSLVLFFAFFWLMLQGRLDVYTLHAINNVLLTGIYFFWMAFKVRATPKQDERLAHKQAAKSGIIFLIVLLGLSPVLKTLTEDIATDTVITVLAGLVLVNVLTHRYGEERQRQPHPLALNAVVCGATMLASRLRTRAEVFALMSLSVIWLGLFPYARNYAAMMRYPASHRAVTALLTAVTSVTLHYIGGHFMWQYLALSALVLYVGPAWLHYLQRYKSILHGPWDEASINKKTS